jgi:hypothetical protein
MPRYASQSDMITNTKTGHKLDDTTPYRRNDMSENTLIDHQLFFSKKIHEI